MKKITSLKIWIGCLLACTTNLSADTAVPAYINYQTYVTDENGSPLGNTEPLSKDMIFRFYAATTGGNPIYSEKQTCLIYKGQVSTLLGQGAQYSTEPKPELYSIFVVPEIFLEVAIDNGSGTFLPITPRQRIASSPYAYRATIAESVADQSISTAMIADASVTTGKIGNGAITAAKIASNSITAAQIGTGAVTTDEILDGTITGTDIATSAITSSRIAAGAVNTSELGDSSVTSAKIVDRTIGTNDIATGAITANEIASQTITSDKIAVDGVGTSEIRDGTITATDIADATITADKLSSIFAYRVYTNSTKDTVITTGYSCDAWIAIVGGWKAEDIYDIDTISIRPIYTEGENWKINLYVTDSPTSGVVTYVHVLFIRKSCFGNITY
jgi:hypothetical protein